MPPLGFILAVLTLLGAGAAWGAAGRLHRQVQADVLRLTELEALFAAKEREMGETLRQLGDYLQACGGAPLTPDTVVRDAITAHPALRAVFLDGPGTHQPVPWDGTIREFAAQAGQDLAALLHRLEAAREATA